MTLPCRPSRSSAPRPAPGLLTTPLRDRFGIQHRLDHYDPSELARIVVRSARVLDVEIDAAGARAIAERARGTPRVANRLLKRVRDFAQVRGTGAIDTDTANAALAMLGVDDAGLDRLDRDLLTRSASTSAAAPSASPRSRSRSPRRPTRSRTSTSPTCSSAGSSSAPRAAASPPRTPSPTSAWPAPGPRAPF